VTDFVGGGVGVTARTEEHGSAETSNGGAIFGG